MDGEDDEELAKKAPKNRAQRFLWLLLERPNRSLLGRIIAFICLITVILSVTIMCLETVFDDPVKKTPQHSPSSSTSQSAVISSAPTISTDQTIYDYENEVSFIFF